MFSLYSQLTRDEKSLKAHYKALSRMTSDQEHREIFNHLYGCLSILDAKCASLLAFNSIIMAVYAIFMAGDLPRVELIALNIGMASIIVSCLLLLYVVWVHWSTTENLTDLQKHAMVLLEVRRERTIKYRLAWYFVVAGIVILSTLLTLRLFLRPGRP